ncbi:hypothetical protein STTU_p0139 (plasmid) [Streptomyces sp. Tu6071]|nr:hypothetical protein STTU_p0139 [Streptomyces sp. Tu6071]
MVALVVATTAATSTAVRARMVRAGRRGGRATVILLDQAASRWMTGAVGTK